MKKSFIIGIALVVVFGMLGCFQAEASEDPIKFGAVNPLGDITGEQASRAMELAVEELNEEGGILGRPVELTVIDSELSSEKGASAVERLATVENVDFLVGGMSSGVHMAQIPVMKRHEITTVWMGGASHEIERAVGEGEDWYFHIHPWDYQQGASYADGWRDIEAEYADVEIDDFYLAYEEGAFGTDSYESYIEYYEMAQQGEGPYAGLMQDFAGESFTSAAVGGGDYRAMLRHASDYDPDIFVWAGYDADAVPMLEQARELGFDPDIFAGSPPGWPADFGENPLAEDVILYQMWAPSINEVSPVAQDFWDSYVEKFEEEPATYFAPLGYTNIKFVAQAVEHAETMEQEEVISALREIEYDSPLGRTLDISPSRIISNQGFSEQMILQWQDGVQEVIWPFELSTAELIYPFEW